MTRRETIQIHTWPQQFLADFERTGPALWFYIYLLTHRNPKTGCVRGSFRKVAAEIGVSTVTLQEWLSQLEQEGYLKDESLDSKMAVRIEMETAARCRSGAHF